MADSIRGILLDNFGRPIAGATVTVYKASTVSLASLYSDSALTASVGNPLTTEADGSYLAFAPNARYDIVPAKTGYTFDTTDSVGEVAFDPAITRTVSATDSMVDKDYVVLLDAGVAPLTFNLLALSNVIEGQPYVLIKKDATANAVTIDPSGAETINGAATLVLSAKQGVVIRKSGTEWRTDTPPAQLTSGAGLIPLGRSSDGKLDSSWGGGNSSLATLDSAGKIPAAQGGAASSVATLDTNTRVVQPANTIYDSVGNRSASPNYSANVVPVRDTEGSLLFKPATLMVVPLGISLDWLTNTVVGTGTTSLRGMSLRQATSAASNDLVRDSNTSTPFMPGDFFAAPKPVSIEWTVILPDVTNSTYHCRLSAVNTDPSAADTHDHVGFKIINQAVYATNGNGASGNATDTTLLAITPGINRLRVVIDASAIRYYVNGILGATHTTNLPDYVASANYMVLQTKTTTTAIRIAHWQRLLYEKGM